MATCISQHGHALVELSAAEGLDELRLEARHARRASQQLDRVDVLRRLRRAGGARVSFHVFTVSVDMGLDFKARLEVGLPTSLPHSVDGRCQLRCLNSDCRSRLCGPWI